jgi:hypothetical protein
MREKKRKKEIDQVFPAYAPTPLYSIYPDLHESSCH